MVASTYGICCAWNEFLISLLMITRTALRHFLWIMLLSVSFRWIGPASVFSYPAVPLVLLFLLLRRHFVAGLTAGAVKVSTRGEELEWMARLMNYLCSLAPII